MFQLTQESLQRQQAQLPVDPRILLIEGGLEYDVAPLPGLTSVMFRRTNGKLACIIDSGLKPRQINLAGAHILGHALLHQDRFDIGTRHEDKLFTPTLDLDGLFTPEEEQKALMIGLEAVVPTPTLRHGFRVSRGDVDIMAKAFAMPKVIIRRLCIREGLLDVRAA